ncbi:histidinol-phosphate transaminase [Photobacterium alginatilyticum]|uniref:Histidinol-phosphate aminotransferase n=1 Tax=Photobacterium alginatilyticum TaxID=1775171 RepID=A0ABW9YE38_9GAMM|nr:histidinol-phosphate transaminase [Photobacterium alginatilyticum]
MKSLASRLVPKTVEKLIPYQSARRIGGSGHLWLNANELEQSCRYGAGDGEYHRYPDFLPHELADTYRVYCQGAGDTLNCDAVAVRGADEAIDLMIRTFCQPGADKIMICPPTYAMYEFCAESIAVEAVKAPLLDDFQLDMTSITKQLAETKILFLCSPNNPTGNVINQADIITLLEAGKESTLIVVDEAYIEFAPDTSVINLIEQYPHLVVIRTLSKAFGLAAIRCGFLLADSCVMEYISRLIAPYPIADPVAEIALRALDSDGIQKMRIQSDELISTREWFAEEVQKLAIVERVYVSATNFVLIRFASAECMYSYLLSKGIVTRNQVHEPALANCVRISIGSKSSMLETLNALQEYK